jgi:aspartate aminotransferase
MSIPINEHEKTLIMPENLKIGMMVNQKRKEKGEGPGEGSFYNYVLGQSPFHAPETLRNALKAHVDKNEYAPAAGITPLKEAVSAFNKRHFNMAVDSKRIVVGPGTKMIMYMLLRLLKGHVFLPTPSWIGYTPILDYLEKPYTLLRLKGNDNYAIDLSKLETLFKDTNGPKILILNNPHNPTGTVYKKDALKALTKVCRKYEVTVIADEIYGLMTFDIKDFTSMGTLYPEKTFITNGLSKDRSAAGYRLGTCILPTDSTDALRELFTRFASTMYTNTTTPVQYAALEAYKQDSAIEVYMDKTRELHALAGHYLSKYANQIEGLRASTPEGAFYFVLDFNTYKKKLKKAGITTANKLMYALLEAPYNIALVTGHSIGLEDNDFLARIAFVDYNGKAVYEAYLKENPQSIKAKEAFIKKRLAHMFEGFDLLKQFLSRLK